MKNKDQKPTKKNCLNCNKPFSLRGPNHRYCSDDCSQKFRSKGEIETLITNKTLKFSEIPLDFILENITTYHKITLQIKYYIKMKVRSWEGKKYELYEKLSDELNLSFDRVKKIAKE